MCIPQRVRLIGRLFPHLHRLAEQGRPVLSLGESASKAAVPGVLGEHHGSPHARPRKIFWCVSHTERGSAACESLLWANALEPLLSGGRAVPLLLQGVAALSGYRRLRWRGGRRGFTSSTLELRHRSNGRRGGLTTCLLDSPGALCAGHYSSSPPGRRPS